MADVRVAIENSAVARRGEATIAARELVKTAGLRAVVLVEGVSDRVAVETLAARRGRTLDADGVCVVPIGGAMSIGRYLGVLDTWGSGATGLHVVGLCDVGEEQYFQRALEQTGRGVDVDRAGMERLGFFVCRLDLEDELIRSLGVAGTLDVLESEGDHRTFQTFQLQPAQRARPIEQQLRRFMGTISGRKEHYARSLVDALDLERVPRPLDALLERT
jgi:OLD-like protein